MIPNTATISAASAKKDPTTSLVNRENGSREAFAARSSITTLELLLPDNRIPWVELVLTMSGVGIVEESGA